MDHWTEIRTALCVARHGTVSRAAEDLGVHRATVNRHIDTLEAGLGVRLFLRHRRGYELTDTGKEFLTVATRAYSLLDDFFGRARLQSADLEGEIVVTTLVQLSRLILPAVLEFRRRYPRTRVRFNTGDDLVQLERAEAHVALRVGAKPAHSDYVVQPFCTLKFALFAHRTYIDRHGRPDFHTLDQHVFVGNPNQQSRSPFEIWLAQNVSPKQVALQSSDANVIETAIFSGEGIGFMPVGYAQDFPDLELVMSSMSDWHVQSWLVTHVDVHRTDKIQSMLDCLKAVIAPE